MISESPLSNLFIPNCISCDTVTASSPPWLSIYLRESDARYYCKIMKLALGLVGITSRFGLLKSLKRKPLPSLFVALHGTLLCHCDPGFFSALSAQQRISRPFPAPRFAVWPAPLGRRCSATAAAVLTFRKPLRQYPQLRRRDAHGCNLLRRGWRHTVRSASGTET